ncbi:hypothetical protein [Agriterribacter sp.]|uniref:hypothetical protein n=1 Tax=Agriterribacter sp. TaxID=2821509 RepID=UPI002C174904|nr:hypothetical protein [Agriterribacter sp.]HTN08893.1 hypothetical protein [Agriterribacter sp.]
MNIYIKSNISLHAIALVPILIAGTILLSSCSKNESTIFEINASPDIPDSDLLSNADFSIWDSANTLPQNWQMRQIYQNTDVFTHSASGLSIKSNSQGEHILFQTIKVNPNTFYKVTIVIKYDINNYNAGGVYVFDTATRMLLGKYEKANSEGEAQFEFLFNSRNAHSVSIEIGFLDGMSGSFDCGPVQIVQQDYEPHISKTGFSDYLNQKMLLSFDADQFDSSISLLCDYLNSVLQSVIKRYDLFAGELPELQTLLVNRTEYVYLPYYLSVPDSASIAYCQRSSLSLQGILTNEFNIPTRAIHLQDDTQTGFHQFLEYWNPFHEKWIVIDPYFSFRYWNKDGTFLSGEELQNETAPWDKIIPFGQYAFSTSIEELQEMWHNKASFVIKPSYQLSYPF